MYAPPPEAAPSPAAQRAMTRGPILAVCCLGIILFLIAATIVLALIPVYLPNRGLQAGGTSSVNSFVLNPTSVSSNGKRSASNQPLGNDGLMSQSTTQNTADGISTGLGFSAGSITPSGQGVVATSNSGRKRRGFGLLRSERQSGTQNCYLMGRFRHDHCGACIVRVTVIIITILDFIYGNINGQVVFSVTIDINVIIVIPATLTSSTSTAATAATTTAALAG